MIHEYTKIKEFDVVSDIHGCFDELVELVTRLGYEYDGFGNLIHPEKRTLVIAGDITDRGPENLQCFEFVLEHCMYGNHIFLEGNHCNKLFRYLIGNPVTPADGLQETIAELEEGYSDRYMKLIGSVLQQTVPSKIVLDGGKVAVAHACPISENHNDHVYGPTIGMRGSRVHWWEDYSGDQFAIFGHYWMNDPEPRDNWCCVDTSCCRGGELTAIRWPEKEIVQVESTNERKP